jgi:hypothetical protein
MDPISGISTVTYGTAGTSGDLVLTEPGTSTQSDLLRWIGGALYVFSDIEHGEPGPDLADVGLPPQRQTNLLMMDETGLGGNPYTDFANGITYTPTAGEPGFTELGPTYIFLSDLPEPGSIVMLGAGVAVLGVVCHNRRRRAA